MDQSKAAEELAKIRRIMESATQLTVLPGWAAIIGGIIALFGCGLTYRLTGSLDLAAVSLLEPGARATVIALWVLVGVLGVLIDVVLTVRLAKKRGKNPWGRLAQLAAYAMGPPLVAALAFSVALASMGHWGLLPAVWMILYGTAVWMAGILSIRAPGVLGLFFIAMGILALFWASPFALIAVALTFGVGHIAFGVHLLLRFGS